MDDAVLKEGLHLGIPPMIQSTMVAQNHGAGKRKQISKIVCAGTVMMIGVSLILTCLVLGTGGYLISMFGISAESAEIGKNFFQRIAAFYVVYGIAMSIRGYTEGIGDVLFSSISGIAALVSRIIFSYAFAGLCGNMIIAYAEAGSWGVLFFLYLIRILWRQKTSIPPQKAFSKS